MPRKTKETAAEDQKKTDLIPNFVALGDLNRGKGKLSIALIQATLDRTIQDGFTPPSKKQEFEPHTSVMETARRLQIKPEEIKGLIEKGVITPNTSLYNTKDPHGALVQHLRLAGVELTADHETRRRLLARTLEVASLRKALKDLDVKALTNERIREEIFGLAAAVVEPPKFVLSKYQAGTEIPMVIFTDWHFGEVIRKEEMNGMNEFNLEVLDQRIEIATSGFLYNYKERVKATGKKPPYAVVMLGGDYFSNEIHDELIDTNQEKMGVLVPLAVSRIIWALEKIADECGQVVVPAVGGNHDRMDKKPRNKKSAAASYSTIVLAMAEHHFKNNPKYKDRVKFMVDPSDTVFLPVGEHNYLLTHGNNLGAKGGNAITGITGQVLLGALRQWIMHLSMKVRVDTFVIGHFHQTFIKRGIMVGNSLVGWSEYARKRYGAPHAPPSQLMWWSDVKTGPKMIVELVADEKPNRVYQQTDLLKGRPMKITPEAGPEKPKPNPSSATKRKLAA